MLFILVILISLLLQLIFPWWIIGPVAFGVAALKGKTAPASFGGAFLAIFILWSAVALLKSIPNEHLLANRVGQMFMLPDASYTWMVVLAISGMVGGLAAGFSALAGFYVRKALRR